MTLIEIIQEVCQRVKLPQPSVVVSSTDDLSSTLLSLANASGKALAKVHDWNILTRVVTFTGVASQVQTGHPPTPFDRFTRDTDLWDVNARRKVIGVTDQNTWLRLTIDPVVGPTFYWSKQAGVINILPAPTTSDSFTYSYQSKLWIQPAGETDTSAYLETFAADTDTPVFDAELMILDLIWRFKQAKQLDYAEDMATFERQKELAIATDRGPRTISTTHSFRGDLPATFWPGTITY